MSNILKVFNPPESIDLSDEKPCIQCQVMATVAAVAAGTYMATGMVFNGEKPGVNSKNWKMFIRSSGIGLIGYGIYRGGEYWLWNVDKKKAPLN